MILEGREGPWGGQSGTSNKPARSDEGLRPGTVATGRAERGARSSRPLVWEEGGHSHGRMVLCCNTRADPLRTEGNKLTTGAAECEVPVGHFCLAV